MAGVYKDTNTNFSALYRNSYASIGGVDIKVVIAGKTVGNIQAISYSITREKAPVYTMGSVEPRGFARGKRGIAGSLVFVMFDMHALLSLFRVSTGNDTAYHFVNDKDEVRPDMPGLAKTWTDWFAGTPEVHLPGVNTNQEGAYTPGSAVSSGWELIAPYYSDQVPAFNIVLVGVNEDGMASQMGVLGAEILNEGYGVSVNDLVSEQQMTYVARAVSAWSGIQNSIKNPASVKNIKGALALNEGSSSSSDDATA
jgi:hypothetical protein